MGIINISRIVGPPSDVPTPPTGVDSLYNDGGTWYFKDDLGNVSTVGTGVSLTSAGGTTLVDDGTGPVLSIKGLTAGTGVSLSSTSTEVTITNSSPDQVVTLTPGTGIGITGTYPSFTIDNTDPAAGVTLNSAGGIESLIDDGIGPTMALRGLTAGSGITLTGGVGEITIAATGGGGGIAYDDMTKIPQDMVWDNQSSSNGPSKVGGGLMYNFGTTAFTPVADRAYICTIILQPGETLDEIEFYVPAFTTAGNVDIGLYSLTPSNSFSAAAFKVGQLEHTISSALAITSTGDKVVTGIGYTATAGTTYNNVYAVALFMGAGTFTLGKLSTNNLLPHVMGGAMIGGTYYRHFIEYVSASSPTVVADLSIYSHVYQTSPNWFVVYKTQ